MAVLEQMSARLRYGSLQQRASTWQKLISLEQSGLEGEEVASSGLLPILLAMLEQRPSRRTQIQNQAASLLLEAAGSDAGMEALMACDCIPRLTTSLRSGSYTKKSKVIAILGMLSLCCQLGPKAKQPCIPHDAWPLYTAALPEVITVIGEAGCNADPACIAMMLTGLEAMLSGAKAIDCFVKAGGLAAFDMLLVQTPCEVIVSPRSSCIDDDSGGVKQWRQEEDVWLPALGVLSQVVKFNVEGAQTILQGPLLSVLMQCCSSTSPEVQLGALVALLNLAAVERHRPTLVKAGQTFHLGVAMHSPSPLVQDHALKCIKLLAPVLGARDEQVLISAMQGLTGDVQDSQSVCGESLDSASDDDEEEGAMMY